MQKFTFNAIFRAPLNDVNRTDPSESAQTQQQVFFVKLIAVSELVQVSNISLSQMFVALEAVAF
jgi:hypothetical protein